MVLQFKMIHSEPPGSIYPAFRARSSIALAHSPPCLAIAHHNIMKETTVVNRQKVRSKNPVFSGIKLTFLISFQSE